MKFLSEKGITKEELFARMQQYKKQDPHLEYYHFFSLLYFAGYDVLEVLREAYNMYFSENALNPTAFPSLRRYENETVAMTAELLNGDDKVRGNMTSGGTESILLAVKTARDYALAKNPNLANPEIIVPISAHPAFDKAAHFLGIKIKHIETDKNSRAIPEKMEEAITENTVLLVASAPSYPHGVLDPIEEIGKIAEKHGILFHVDACIGGFMLPFLEKAGYAVPPFDFRVPGVTSISADIHKYGYAAKGASVILYRNKEIRKHQFFVYTEWTGGIYGSPGVLGTRSGGSIAAAWAVWNYLGEEGYLKLAVKTKETTDKIIRAIREEIPELKIIGDPVMTIFAVTSDEVDIYAVGDELSAMGYHLDRQQFPPSLHFTLHPAHAEVWEKLIEDIKLAVRKVKKQKLRSVSRNIFLSLAKTAVKWLPKNLVSKLTVLSSKIGGSEGPKRKAAMYGMLGELPNREDLNSMILEFMDKLFTLPAEKKNK